MFTSFFLAYSHTQGWVYEESMQKCVAKQWFLSLPAPLSVYVYSHLQKQTFSTCSDRSMQVRENKCGSTKAILWFILSSTIPVFSAAYLHLLPLPSLILLLHLFLFFLPPFLPWILHLSPRSCLFFSSFCLVRSNLPPLFSHLHYRSLFLPSPVSLFILSFSPLFVCVFSGVCISLFKT